MAEPSSPVDPRLPMGAQRLHLWQIQAVRDAMWVGALVLLIWLGYVMRAVTVPLLVALLLAYLFEPLIARLTRNPRIKRTYVVAGLLCTLIVTIVIALAIVVPIVVGQTARLAQDLRRGQLERSLVAIREYLPETMREDYDSALESFQGLISGKPRPRPLIAATQPEATQPENVLDDAPPGDLSPTAEEELREIIRAEVAAQLAEQAPEVAAAEGESDRLASWLALGKRGAQAVLAFLGAVLQIGFLLFLIPFYFFFFSVWYPHVVRFGRGLIPVVNRGRTLELLGKMDRAVAGFVRGRIVISLAIGVMLAIGWTICGVPYAVVLGLLIGIFSAVPYLGGVGIPLAIMLLWVNQLGQPVPERMSLLWIFGGPILVFVIVQIIETYILTPLIAGKATNLDPVTILVAVIAGGNVGGVYGMILAIPVAACAKILFTDVLLPKIRQWLQGEAEDPLPIGRT